MFTKILIADFYQRISIITELFSRSTVYSYYRSETVIIIWDIW